MFQRKLSALGYPNAHSFDATDEDQFHNVVVWLEDQKIRRYKIEQREELRNVKSETWDQAYKRYLVDLDCPVDYTDRNEILDWLLSLGVHLEFSENKDLYCQCLTVKKEANPLHHLEFQSADFKAGVETLADLLDVAKHPDHLVTLEAVAKVVKERLDPSVLQDSSRTSAKPGPPISFETIPLGLDLGDAELNHVAKMLRYLFIHDLRDLQTKINECIVAVQTLTADPKTNTKLGKVGF